MSGNLKNLSQNLNLMKFLDYTYSKQLNLSHYWFHPYVSLLKSFFLASFINIYHNLVIESVHADTDTYAEKKKMEKAICNQNRSKFFTAALRITIYLNREK